MIIGYARVLNDDEKLEPQIDALEAAGAQQIYVDELTSNRHLRLQLKLMISQLRQDDVVVVTEYDRLARSAKDLLEIVETIGERSSGFRSLAEDFDTTTPTGRLIFRKRHSPLAFF